MKPHTDATAEMSLALPAEAELVRRACGGCRQSFDLLVRQLRPRLLRFMRRWSVDESAAEDLVQDTFARAYEHLDRYDKRWRFTTWLFTIGRRIAIDQSRRSKRLGPKVELTIEPGESDSPAQRIIRAEQRERLWRIVETHLSRAQAEAVWLRYGESLDVSEIAKVMGKSQVGVRVTLLRARKALAPHVRSLIDPASPSGDDDAEQAA